MENIVLTGQHQAESVDARPKFQVCKCCGKELPIESFRMTRLGRMGTCKECVSHNIVKAKLDKKIAKLQVDDVEKAKKARLSEFQPRELMAELKRRGYDFTMEFTEKHVIHSKDIKI